MIAYYTATTTKMTTTDFGINGKMTSAGLAFEAATN
jgi:hypothetical protein